MNICKTLCHFTGLQNAEIWVRVQERCVFPLSVFCSEAFWKLKPQKFKNLFICKCALMKFSVVHLNRILLFVFPDCQVSILKHEVDGKGGRNGLCKLVHVNVCFATSVFSSSMGRPFCEVQFCIFSQWIFFFCFPFFLLYAADISPESMISDLACPLFIPSQQPFFCFSSVFSARANLFFKDVPLTNWSSPFCCWGCISPQLTTSCKGLFHQNLWKELVNLECCLQLSSLLYFTFLSDLYCPVQLHLLLTLLKEILVYLFLSFCILASFSSSFANVLLQIFLRPYDSWGKQFYCVGYKYVLHISVAVRSSYLFADYCNVS